MFNFIDFHPGDYCREEFRLWQGCPTVACTRKGRLFCGWYTGGTREPSLENFNMLFQSDDGGKSWSNPILCIRSDKAAKHHHIDIQLWTDPQGRLWLCWTRRDYRYRQQDIRHLLTFRMICKDPDAEKLEWSEPEFIANGFLRCQPTALSDGRILLCAYDWTCNYYMYSESSDGGTTWTRCTGGAKPKTDFDESMILEAPDGRLRMFARHAPYIMESVSRDGGFRWTPGKETAFQNPSSRFFIRRLRSGNVIFVRNDNYARRDRMTARLSTDGGETFQYQLMLDERNEVSYPDLAELPDGSLYILYDRERTGAKEILAARITEADILAGKLVSEKSCLRHVISKAPEKPYCGEAEWQRQAQTDRNFWKDYTSNQAD